MTSSTTAEIDMDQPVFNIDVHMYVRSILEARLRVKYTSRRHDYHNGTAEARFKKFFAGCLGEAVFGKWLIRQNVLFVKHVRKPWEPDRFDFMVSGLGMVNVKAEVPGRRGFRNTLLVTLAEIRKRPCDYYVAVLLQKNKIFTAGQIMGWVSLAQVKAAQRVHGYEDDYAIPYKALEPLPLLLGQRSALTGSRTG